MAIILSSIKEHDCFTPDEFLKSHPVKTLPSYHSFSRLPSKRKSLSTFNLAVSPSCPLSPSSTPSTTVILDAKVLNTCEKMESPINSFISGSFDNGEEDQIFPFYEQEEYYELPEDSTLEPIPADTLLDIPTLPLPKMAKKAKDDIAISEIPSQHVDYLSHKWREEDLWASWRHVVCNQEAYSNSARLENASWRMWGQYQYNLETVSADSVNWLKDYDITWLYGPLQVGSRETVETLPGPSEPNGRSTRTASLPQKSILKKPKPILKKRSILELMARRSLSAVALLKQATSSFQRQQVDWNPDASSSFSSSRRSSSESVKASMSMRASADTPPSPSKAKHVRFNEKVAQSIVPSTDEEEKPSKVSSAAKSKRTSSRSIPKPESKMLVALPPTTLKCKDHVGARIERKNTIAIPPPLIEFTAPSPQKASKPPMSFDRFLFLDYGDEEDADFFRKPANGKESIAAARTLLPEFRSEESFSGVVGRSLNMPMIYDDDDDYVLVEELFGK